MHVKAHIYSVPINDLHESEILLALLSRKREQDFTRYENVVDSTGDP